MDGAALRIAGLWAAWLLVMLFHVELGLMPLFHGASVTIESQVSPRLLPRLFTAMFLYFLIPVLAMVLALHAATEPGSWSGQSPWRAAQFWLSVLYSLTNLIHWIADIKIPDSRVDQVLLMGVLSAIGLGINLEAWRWWQL
jgi:hypothetical protein